MAACVVALFSGNLLGQALPAKDVTFTVAGASNTFSYRGVSPNTTNYYTGYTMFQGVCVPSDRRWGWNGTLNTPAYPSSPANSFMNSSLIPPSLRVNIPSGTTDVKVVMSVSMDMATAISHPMHATYGSGLWAGAEYYFGGVFASPDRYYIRPPKFYVYSPSFRIKPVTGSWLMEIPSVVSFSTKSDLVGVGSVSLPASARSYSVTREFSVPSGFSGQVDLRFTGFTLLNAGICPLVGSGGLYILRLGNYHVPTGGTVAVTYKGTVLSGEVGVPSSVLREGFTGNIPVDFEVWTD